MFGTPFRSLEELKREPAIVSGGKILIRRPGKTPITVSAGTMADGKYKVWAYADDKTIAEFTAGNGQSTHSTKQAAWNAILKRIETYAKL